MAKRKAPVIEGKDDATRAELVGQFRRDDFHEFMKNWKLVIEEKKAIDSPVKLYAMFQVYYKDKILEAMPELGGQDDMGFHRSEHALNALLHRIMPGYNQFIEIYLENFDPGPKVEQTSVEMDVATRARARVREGETEISVEERRNRGSSGDDHNEV